MLDQVTAEDIRGFCLPWTVQASVLGLFAVGYPVAAAGVYMAISGSAGGIIAGSVLGAYPVFLAEVAKAVKNPCIRVREGTRETPADGGIICKYPHRWYAYNQSDVTADGEDPRLETHVSINASRTVVTLQNDGWGRATKCRAWIRLEEAAPPNGRTPETYRFPARWERADNPLELDLTPGEGAEVVLSEVDLYDGAFKTALSNKLPEEVRTTPHEYARAERFEIKRDASYRVSVVATSDDMPLVERPIDLGNGPGNAVTIPEFAKRASEWGVLEKLREDADRISAVWYREDGRDVLLVEDGFDLANLRHANPDGQSELQGPYLPDTTDGRAYRDVLEAAGFVIVSVDEVEPHRRTPDPPKPETSGSRPVP